MADWKYPEDYREDGVRKPLKWEARKRFEFIEFMLYWEQRLTAKHVSQYFEVSDTQAFSDINLYRKLTVPFGANDVVCNVKPRPSGNRQGFEAADDMICRYIIPRFDDFMQFFEEPSRATWMSAASKTYIPRKLDIERVATLSRRNIDPVCARAVIRAIDKGLTLKVDYFSPSYSKSQTITITPRCLGYDGFRWHTRAYRHDLAKHDLDPNAYRDVVLERIKKVKEFMQQHRVPKDPGADLVAVEVIPNPDLDSHEQVNIAAQYQEMQSKVWKTLMPGRMVPYFLKRYQLEEKSIRKAPHQEPLAIGNREAVTNFLDAGWRVPPHHGSDPIEPLLKKLRARRPNTRDVDIIVEALKRMAK